MPDHASGNSLKNGDPLPAHRFFTSLKHISGVRATQRSVPLLTVIQLPSGRPIIVSSGGRPAVREYAAHGFHLYGLPARVGEVRVDLQREQI